MFMHVQDKVSMKKRKLEQEQDPLLGPSSSSGQFSRRDSATWSFDAVKECTPLQHQNSPRSSAPTPSTHPSRMRQTTIPGGRKRKWVESQGVRRGRRAVCKLDQHSTAMHEGPLVMSLLQQGCLFHCQCARDDLG